MLHALYNLRRRHGDGRWFSVAAIRRECPGLTFKKVERSLRDLAEFGQAEINTNSFGVFARLTARGF